MTTSITSSAAITSDTINYTGGWIGNAGTLYVTQSGTQVELVQAVANADSQPEEDVTKSRVSTKIRGKKKVKGEKENTIPKYTRFYGLTVNPKIFFKFVKSKLSEIEVVTLKKRLNKIRPLLLQAEQMKQHALFEELSLQLAVIVREQEAYSIGFDKSLRREHITKFMSKVEDRCVKFEMLEKFPRVIPSKIRAKIKSVQEKKVFDDFHVLYLDYTNEELKTNKQKIREKDPILFGSFKFQPDVFYFICDWVDKYCDLTLSKLIEEIQLDDPEFELDTLPELDKKYVDAIMKDVEARHDRLAKTKPSNFRDLMAEEDTVKENTQPEESEAKKDSSIFDAIKKVVRIPFGRGKA